MHEHPRSARPAREEDIVVTEASLGVRLPAWLRARLLDENGWTVDDTRGATEQEWTFLPVFDRRDRKAMTRTAENLVWFTTRLHAEASVFAAPAGAVVIATTRYADRLVLLPADDDPGALAPDLWRFAPGADPTRIDRDALGRPPVAPPGSRLRPRSDLPQFRYHPDPVGTGSVIEHPAKVCPSCGLVTGWAYVTTPYARGTHHDICPWCIADGSAAERFGASFVDVYWVDGDEPPAPEDRLDELTARTPGFVSWQQEEWQYCCGDACAFHGVASADTIEALPEAERDAWGFDDDYVAELRRLEAVGSEPGDAVPFEFRCLHCGRVRIWLDVS